MIGQGHPITEGRWDVVPVRPDGRKLTATQPHSHASAQNQGNGKCTDKEIA